MTRKLWLLLAVVLASGLVAAGCGDDDDDGGGSDEPAQEQSGGDAGGSEDTGGGGSDATPDNADEAIEQAKERCKAAVEGSPSSNNSLKADFLELCDEIESAEDVARVVKEICIKTIEQSNPPAGVREQALQACEQATPTP
jgi:hypothetical protein